MNRDEHHARILDLLPKVTQGEWRVEDGANSHFFDLLVKADGGECVAFSDEDDAALIALAPETARHFDAVMQENARLRRTVEIINIITEASHPATVTMDVRDIRKHARAALKETTK